MEGIPTCHGLIDGRYLVLDYIDVDSLKTHKLADADGFYARLRELVARIHAAGVAHGDLGRRSNVLDADGEHPVLIDFSVALRVEPRSSWLRRRAVELMQQDDRDCWVKLKYRRARFAPPEEPPLERPGPLMRLRKPVKRLRQLRGARIGSRLETSGQNR